MIDFGGRDSRFSCGHERIGAGWPTFEIADSGAQAILDAIRKRWPWVEHLFADGAYDRTKLMELLVRRIAH
ncbi:hypothetical protein REMIM1_PC00138 (plasmid) [Rhizobium etli bv. mimosae str. Mim1]|nr:hypothetical protein REMIM1_PC00138 [Rhizobium etli bv. mimosae str. Mim1]